MTQPIDILPTVRALVHCYQAFVVHSESHIRTLGLTPAQFDIIATLGNTPGMTATELGEKTLITKGTLTGVVDRLVDRGWVERVAHQTDRRCQIVRLTKAGDQCFSQVFPAHLAFLQAMFAGATRADHANWQAALASLQAQLTPESPT